jgi:2,4'-dihydroxyacetophenone dioxygenase
MAKVGMTFDPIGASLVRTSKKEWIATGDGNEFLVLRISKETGVWSALVKAKAGQVNAPHTHIGPADFYVLSGGFDYRGGSAREGDWVYEPAGAVHEATTHPVDTVYLANVHGPVAFHDDKGGFSYILDWRAVQKMVETAAAKKKKPVGSIAAAKRKKAA